MGSRRSVRCLGPYTMALGAKLFKDAKSDQLRRRRHHIYIWGIANTMICEVLL